MPMLTARAPSVIQMAALPTDCVHPRRNQAAINAVTPIATPPNRARL